MLQRGVFPKAPTAVVDIGEQVKRYGDWLATEARHTSLNGYREEARQYVDEALKVVRVRGKDIRTFAPFRQHLSAFQTLTHKQAFILSGAMLALVLAVWVYGMTILVVALALIMLFYVGDLLLNACLALYMLDHPAGEHVDSEVVQALAEADWPRYTILCPLYREAEVVPQFVQAMQALDYPTDKLEILFLTEESDSETRQALEALHLPAYFTIVTVPEGQPRTKPRACNYGLTQATGQYVVIYDAEDIPDPLQLKKAVLTFANHGPELGCIQAKLNFYNTQQNLLTRWFTAEYSMWFDLILPGFQKLRVPFPLGGTSNHFRASVLRALGGWDAFNVTEDCDLGLRMAHLGFKMLMLDSTTYEEANSRLKNWIRQRSRWIKGYIQTYLVYMRHPQTYLRPGHLGQFLSLQLIVGGKTAALFLNPAMWALTVIYILFRPVNVYHMLFPGPLLYMGALCLIFGNFLYMYVHLIGCMKRGHYHLVVGALFIPFNWLLASAAGFVALFELLVKPHYWQKTRHGLHLKGIPGHRFAGGVSQARHGIPRFVLGGIHNVSATIGRIRQRYGFSALRGIVSKIGAIPALSTGRRLLSSMSVSVMPPESTKVERASLPRDRWFLALVAIACLASVIAWWYFFQHHEILLYQDAFSHMRIARSVFDSATPGLAQLGSIWLPLPHILMWPFVWNNSLWYSGLAGSFVSMPCFVITAVYLFRSARRVTHSSSASFIGTLLFIFNPNVLYLQSVPMTELVCMATFTMAAYYFLSWAQDGELKQLIIAAGCAFLATLARYDGWALFLGLFCAVPLVSLLKHQKVVQVKANLAVFSVLGGLGIALWLLWNKIIFGDPFYFRDSIYAIGGGSWGYLQAGTAFSYHNLWQAIRFYTIDSAQTVGIILLVLVAVGVIWLIVHARFTPTTIAALVFLMYFPFYIAAQYSGDAVIWLPGANPPGAHLPLYDVRYGAQMAVPAALFVAIFVERMSSISLFRSSSLRRGMLQFVLIAVIGVQSVLLVASPGILSLQDAQAIACASPTAITDYLTEHYDGGRILEDVFTTQIDPATYQGDFKSIIYEGSDQLWLQALHDPVHSVEWILVDPTNKKDLVAQHVDLTSPVFLSQFTLVAGGQNETIVLYHRKGGLPLPTRPAPPTVKFDCNAGNPASVVPPPAQGSVVLPSTQERTSLGNLARAYAGILYNIPLDLKTKMSLTIIQRNQNNIRGDFSGLQVNGLEVNEPFSGMIDAHGHIQFTVTEYAGQKTLSFKGSMKSDGTLAGNYCSLNQQGQCATEYGLWEVVPLSGGGQGTRTFLPSGRFSARAHMSS